MLNHIQQLGRAVKQAQYRQHRALENALAEAGTTLAQWDALRAIDRTPGASSHDLALATFQTDQAFGTLANRLVAQGLIERRAGQGRRIEHFLTTEGAQILATGNQIANTVLTSKFAILNQAEQKTLLKLLTRITDVQEQDF
ncbi:helix-turn-helix domain-containing protein [Undibacterium sp. TS12]|uniref:MarR family winged helix-turn-helix transcriptional regulator n=1 Tax=Undibacterium sp. TS12 TaxID=2908202 RepID=UPI001F4C7160|nr:helix-turn-helix domain-containing protein [Undibacterium sp. TS12]MCH8617513.1 MarR family winged helix-turn-helix transcriptional regulator [Undibacterium sp. TS12]